MSTINVIENIKNETGSKLTPAQIAYELKKASAGLTEEKIEQLKAEKPLTADEKKEAMATIGNFLAAKESDNTMPQLLDRLENITNPIENSDNQPKTLDGKEVQSLNGIDGKNNKIELPPPTDNEVKQFVIPVIADKIITNGKDGVEKNTVTYDSDNFTAMLRLGDEEQVISLDRNNVSPEETNALIATKANSQQEYQIIINNVKAEEFERFKALLEKATQERNGSGKGQLKRDNTELD